MHWQVVSLGASMVYSCLSPCFFTTSTRSRLDLHRRACPVAAARCSTRSNPYVHVDIARQVVTLHAPLLSEVSLLDGSVSTDVGVPAAAPAAATTKPRSRRRQLGIRADGVAISSAHSN